MSDLGELRDLFGDKPFLRRDAVAGGISKWQLDSGAVKRPFRGVHTLGDDDDVASRARAYARKIIDGRAFTGLTAAQLRGWPTPRRFTERTRIDVAGPHSGNRVREEGIDFVRVTDRMWRHATINGLPVASAELTLLALARICTVDELVVLGDAAISTSTWYPGLVERGSTTIESLTAFLDECGRMPGVARLRLAMERMRANVESPMETLTRLAIVDAGLPEPEVGGEIWEHGERIATCDLVFREARVVVEYEGNSHSERSAFEYDIARIRRLESFGWKVIRLTHRDLFPSTSRFVEELSRVLAQRAA